MWRLAYLFFCSIGLYSLILSCQSNPKTIKMEVVDWKSKSIDSIELLYFPDYLDQKNYTHQMIIDTHLNRWIQANISSDTISLKKDNYQYKIYLFNQGEPFKTLYISTINGNEFLSYVVHGERVYHALHENIKLALQE